MAIQSQRLRETQEVEHTQKVHQVHLMYRCGGLAFHRRCPESDTCKILSMLNIQMSWFDSHPQAKSEAEIYPRWTLNFLASSADQQGSVLLVRQDPECIFAGAKHLSRRRRSREV